MREILRGNKTTAALAALVLLAVSGCGSSENGNDASSPLTTRQFTAKGNQICQKGLEEKDALVKAAIAQSNASEGGEPSPKKEREVAESILSQLHNVIAELSELPPPAKDKSTVEALLAKFEAGMEKAQGQPRTIFRTNFFEAGDVAARSYGLEACTF